MIKERSIVLYIILSIITCGIFGLYWFVCITEDTNAAADVAGTSGGLALLFTIITCGIYGFYWAYKCGEKIDIAKEKRRYACRQRRNSLSSVIHFWRCNRLCFNSE